MARAVIAATAVRATHLWSDGTTYQGASFVLVAVRASSYASV
jgi:hypothetical protein